jgi:hypothetical protein
VKIHTIRLAARLAIVGALLLPITLLSSPEHARAATSQVHLS